MKYRETTQTLFTFRGQQHELTVHITATEHPKYIHPERLTIEQRDILDNGGGIFSIHVEVYFSGNLHGTERMSPAVLKSPDELIEFCEVNGLIQNAKEVLAYDLEQLLKKLGLE